MGVGVDASVGDGWDRRFEGMLPYAAQKGWLGEGGIAVQAHREWPEVAA